ncbi:hypothetical protein EJB05_47279, partial [Eragrostis curvula]
MAAVKSIERLAQRRVVPAEPTPAGRLCLSWLDRYPTQRVLCEVLQVFTLDHPERGNNTSDDAPAKTIEVALARALVHYYPLAGRLVLSDAGVVEEVDCANAGVWFTEAKATCTLEDVEYLQDSPAMMIPKDELLPPLKGKYGDDDNDTVILLFQVTTFSCGGFVVGFRISHVVADGLGAGQFINAVGELARGAETVSVEPQWGRDAFPDPAAAGAIIGSLPEPVGAKKLGYLAMDISADYIEHLKGQYSASNNGGWCSTFDVVIAKAWQTRTRTGGFDPDSTVHLCFAMNVRPLLHDSLPHRGAGFYGNCYYIMRVSAPARKVAASSVPELVTLIKDGKRRMPAEFARWVAGEAGTDPYQVTSDYQTMLVSNWTKLGFAEADYGWGPPAHVVPLSFRVMELDFLASCILARPFPRKPGARLITRCVTPDRVNAFHQGMIHLSSSMEPN